MPERVPDGPALGRRHRSSASVPGEGRRTLTLGFFGTSIMEHLEAFNKQMAAQASLPEIGSKIIVEGWRQRGWVHRLVLSLRAARPYVTFDVQNHSQGGATSRDLVSLVAADRASAGTNYDLTFVGCGINDVWRRFQNRRDESVDLDEYTIHLGTMLDRLGDHTRRIIVLSETPFGPVDSPETVTAMNAELARYNAAAAQVAISHGALFLDVWAPFLAAARHLAAAPAEGLESSSLWSDGVHLNELGDTVLLQQVERMLAEYRVVEGLLN